MGGGVKGRDNGRPRRITTKGDVVVRMLVWGGEVDKCLGWV